MRCRSVTSEPRRAFSPSLVRAPWRVAAFRPFGALGLVAALLPVAAGGAAARKPVLAVSEALPFTATASPAVADLDGLGLLPEVVLSVDNIGYAESTAMDPLDDPDNPNSVWAYGWTATGFHVLPGWPQKTRDATEGVAAMDLDGDGQMEVFGACSQDNYVPAGFTVPFVSRLYVWDAAGTPKDPWAPWSLRAVDPPDGNSVGVTEGHAYAAPVVFEDADGKLHILQAAQGIWASWDGGASYPRYGSLSIWSPTGDLEAKTSAAGASWMVYDGPDFSRFSLDVPPVVAREGNSRNIVAATTDGVLYMWRGDNGEAVPGWHPSAGARTQADTLSSGERAPIRSPIAAADLNGDGDDEVLAATGDTQSANNGQLYANGILYCWNPDGTLRWRYPSLGTGAAFTSGIAVGRLGGSKSAGLCVVVGDAAGVVRAFDRNGKLLWQFATAPGSAVGQYPIYAEPVVGDVDNDGTQDVVVAGTAGSVFALSGKNGRVIWQVQTPQALTPAGLVPEAVYGAPALCDLQGDGRLDVVVVTAQRYYDGTWHGFGHLLAWDCGPGTYEPSHLDWPQYQHDAQRTGRLS